MSNNIQQRNPNTYCSNKEQCDLFFERLKQNLSLNELMRFKEIYYEKIYLEFTMNTEQKLITNIKHIYDILQQITPSNVLTCFVENKNYGICHNLQVKIDGFFDEDNHEIYDIMYCISKLFYKEIPKFRTCYILPIPTVYEQDCWSGRALEYRLAYIKWLVSNLEHLIPILESENVNGAKIVNDDENNIFGE